MYTIWSQLEPPTILTSKAKIFPKLHLYPKFQVGEIQGDTNWKWNDMRYFMDMFDVYISHVYSWNKLRGTHGFHSIQTLVNVYSKYGWKILLDSMSHVEMINGMVTSAWTRLIYGIMYHFPLINV